MKSAAPVPPYPLPHDLPDLELYQTTKYYEAGGKLEVKLSSVPKFCVGVRLVLTVDVANGATPGSPTARENNPSEFLKNPKISAGGDDFINISGRLLHFMNRYEMTYLNPLDHDKFTTAELGAAGNPQASMELIIPFTFPRLEKKWAHLGAMVMPTFPAGQVVFTADWGTVADLMDSAGTHTIASTTCVDVYLLFKNPNAATINQNGYGSFRRISKPIDIANGGEIEIETELQSGKSYPLLYLHTVIGSTQRSSSACVADTDRVKLYVNDTPVIDMFARDLRRAQARILGSDYDDTGLLVIDPDRGYNAHQERNFSKQWGVEAGDRLKLVVGTQAQTLGKLHLGLVQTRPMKQSREAWGKPQAFAA